MKKGKAYKKVEERVIINAENAVLGRLASYAAKQALSGKKVVIVNCGKAIVLGREKDVLEKYREIRGKSRGGGSQKGPFFLRDPERILKRTIRGMLPYKKGRGRERFKEIRCYKGLPPEFENEKMVKSGRGKKGITLEKISRMLKGGRVE